MPPLCIRVLLLLWRRWQKAKVEEAKRWPRTDATVQSSALEDVKPHPGIVVGRLAAFAFSYRFAIVFSLTDVIGLMSSEVLSNRATSLVPLVRARHVAMTPRKSEMQNLPSEIFRPRSAAGGSVRGTLAGFPVRHGSSRAWKRSPRPSAVSRRRASSCRDDGPR